jgi:hypothetical protein
MSGRQRSLLDQPLMRDAFRKELRARLLWEAELILAPRQDRPLFSWASLRSALVAAALIIFVLSSTTNAAAASLPGDPLYGLKRATESVELALTFDEVARLQLLAQLADRRLEELAALTSRDAKLAPTATTEYADAVARFRSAVDALKDADGDDKRAAAQAVAEAARAKHLAVLDALKNRATDTSDIDRLIETEQGASGTTGDVPRGNSENVTTGKETSPSGVGPSHENPRPTPHGQGRGRS